MAGAHSQVPYGGVCSGKQSQPRLCVLNISILTCCWHCFSPTHVITNSAAIFLLAGYWVLVWVCFFVFGFGFFFFLIGCFVLFFSPEFYLV